MSLSTVSNHNLMNSNNGLVVGNNSNVYNLGTSNNNPSSPTSTSSSTLTPTSTSDEMIKKEDGSTSEPSSPTTECNGKKAGRRKIKIEFIDDKSRRHITFSKRKAGIMKKAYELSTLTGTQVLLLVASETGHVYTFATAKLQPLITRPEGKNLIQSCLNTPDNPSSPSIAQNASLIQQQQAVAAQQQAAQQQAHLQAQQQAAQQAQLQAQQQAAQQHLLQQQQQQIQQQQQQYINNNSGNNNNNSNQYQDSVYENQDKEIERRLKESGENININNNKHQQNNSPSNQQQQYIQQNINNLDMNSLAYNNQNIYPLNAFYQQNVQPRYIQNSSASSSPASPNNQYNYSTMPINNQPYPSC